MSSKYWPDQKWFAQGIGGLATWGILLLLTQLGVAIPSGLETVIPVVVAMILHYVVPAADQDVIARINDRIVAMAAADPESPVTPASNAAAAQAVPKPS